MHSYPIPRGGAGFVQGGFDPFPQLTDCRVIDLVFESQILDAYKLH